MWRVHTSRLRTVPSTSADACPKDMKKMPVIIKFRLCGDEGGAFIRQVRSAVAVASIDEEQAERTIRITQVITLRILGYLK